MKDTHKKKPTKKRFYDDDDFEKSKPYKHNSKSQIRKEIQEKYLNEIEELTE